ncbi:MAG TPA: ATP-dependent helicase [Candidatus Bipolaricaulota bacterium]
MTFKPRPAQQEVLDYRGGFMGILAVPGSGKTMTLSHLAAQLVAGAQLGDDQEVLIVTLTNSTVENFQSRIGNLIRERGLLPKVGYQVRTLHGLAHDIVRERPGLVGLSDQFQIVDEREGDAILDDVVQAYVRGHPDAALPYLSPTLKEAKRAQVVREKWPATLKNFSRNFSKRAKDLRLSPTDVAAHVAAADRELHLAQMCYEIFEDYQRALAYRGAVDFDDLIRLACQALEADPQYLERLRQRWPFILEDEAQDSSQLQEFILELLAGPGGNWVRVGDPNQAIYETFTTANPKFLRDFSARTGVKAVALPNSGRSSLSIIQLANHLIDWAQREHPTAQVRHALAEPRIEPTPPGDPQPNPPDDPKGIHLVEQAYSPDGEIKAITDSLERWLSAHPQQTVAVLVPRNERGFKLGEALRKRKIEHVELLQSTVSTRQTAGALSHLLDYLADPKSAKLLAMAFRVWRRADREDEQAKARVGRIAKLLHGCAQVESYLWPQLQRDWLDTLPPKELEAEPDLRDLLEEFRDVIRRWQAAALLPVDQLLLSLGQDLFREPAELALTHKLALLLKRASTQNPAWRLAELSEELKVIATNERRFLGLSADDVGFDPEKYRGMAVVTTMHRAKGLEWDRVYLMSVNTYDFPSAMAYDEYIFEPWFIRDRLNLDAEARAQLEWARAMATEQGNAPWQEGLASQRARLDYAAERLRLLYVGITRARRELVITWNTGQREAAKKTASLPLVALQAFWKAKG